MLRNVHRAIALQRIHINREAFQAARVTPRFFSSQQTASASESNAQQAIDQDETYWRRVFHFPEMKYLALISKIKLYPAGVSVALASTIAIIQACGYIPNASSIPVLYLGM